MAFVHLHNHSDYSMLDAATKIPDMVKRAVDLDMPALALTDHGYMFGVPDFDLECRKYNDAQKDMKQWKHDVECFKKDWELEEPEPDAADAGPHDRVHAQWASDVEVWESSGHDLSAVEANRPELLIKPIFGCEAYFITDDCIEKGTKQHRYHLLLLAKNETGYVNLMKMMSEAGSGDMFYYYPRTTLDMLRRYHEGIICSSACVSGIIPRMYFSGQPDKAKEWALTYKEIFGDDFYLEVQDHGLEDPSWGGFNDRTLSEQIIRLGHELGIKVIATNDNHYLTREDAPTQDILSCIGTASKVDDVNRKRMTGTEFYVKSEEEMRELFSWAPEVIDNTLEVAAKCDYELDWTHMYLPKFPGLREGETSEQRFREECPDVDVDIRMADHVDVPYELLAQGKMDAILVSPQDEGQYEWVHLADDPMFAVLPRDFDTQGMTAFPLAAFEARDFIMPSQGFDKDIMRIFNRIGVKPHILPTWVDDPTVISMVSHGLGVSMMTELTVRGRTDGVKLLPVEPASSRELGLAVRSLDAASDGLRHFIDCTKRVVAEMQP